MKMILLVIATILTLIFTLYIYSIGSKLFGGNPKECGFHLIVLVYTIPIYLILIVINSSFKSLKVRNIFIANLIALLIVIYTLLSSIDIDLCTINSIIFSLLIAYVILINMNLLRSGRESKS